MVKSLRAKPGDEADNPAWIFNRRGVGYRMPEPGEPEPGGGMTNGAKGRISGLPVPAPASPTDPGWHGSPIQPIGASRLDARSLIRRGR